MQKLLTSSSPLGFQIKSCKCWGSGDGAPESPLELTPKKRFSPRKQACGPGNRSPAFGEKHKPSNPFWFLESIWRTKQGSSRACGKTGLEERRQGLLCLGKLKHRTEDGRKAGEKMPGYFARLKWGSTQFLDCSFPFPDSFAVFKKTLPLCSSVTLKNSFWLVVDSRNIKDLFCSSDSSSLKIFKTFLILLFLGC